LIGSDSFRLLIPANRTLTIRISSGLFVRDTIIGNVLNGQTIDIGSINGCPTIPAVVSDSIQAISQTTARCRGFVTGSGGSAVTERGFVWSTSPNPTIDLPTKLAIGSGLGLFEGDINGLSANTTYYARAYAKNNSGVAYGAEIIFQTFSDGIFVTTTLNDQMPSPFVCGGVVESSVVSITERGILYGVSQNLDYNSSQLVGSFQYGASYGGAVPTPGSGGAVPSSGNECGRITSQSGTGSFTVNIMYLFGDVQYYFCAYAKTSSGQVVKGEVRPVPIRSFARSSVEPGRANVFWSPNFNLFDLLTDELIVPENGVYKFYYSSNEDPEVYYKEMPAAELPNFLFYKFKTEANCFKWTQIKKGLLQP
jgi:hypothetical protein